MIVRSVIALATWMVAVAAVAQQTPNFSALEQRVAREIDSGNLPSLAVAVTQGGHIVYARAFGYANVAERKPATVRTAYALASVTKPITATAVLQLAERGRIDLDAPALKYLPSWRLQAPFHKGPMPMVRHLLSHTSGLATYARIHYGDEIARAPALETSVEHYGVLVQPPGSIAEYSNLGYGLLGHIVEKSGGLRFGDYLERHVFGPLRMDDAFVDSPDSAVAEVATAYDVQNRALPMLRNDTPGAGNVYASAQDLIRFAQFHLDPGTARKPVLSPRSVRRMQSKGDVRALHHYYSGAYYGLGWYVRPDDGGERVLWHEGGMPGASTIIKLIPDRRIGVVVLANKTEVNTLTQAVADEALRALLPDYSPGPLDATANYAPYAAQALFRGEWRGSIAVGGRLLPCELSFAPDGKVTLAFESGPGAEQRERGEFAGIVYRESFIGAVPLKLPIAEQANSAAPLLLVKLVRKDDLLRGSLVAYSSPQRLEYLLPVALSLTKQP